MADELKKNSFRLALRQEGNYWCAYHASRDTMEGAVLLGSIAMAAVVDNPERKAAFIAMMQGVISDMVKNVMGVEIDHWNEPIDAPPNERAGHS